MKTVAIIGAGPLGRWLALAAAQAGFRILLEDVMPGNLHHAQEYLRQQLGPGSESVTASNGNAHSYSIEFVGTVEDAVREADLVIDCVPDELESKLEILFLLDRMAPPKTIIATPTTRLEIDDLASCTYRADRCVALVLDPRDFSRDLRTMTIKGGERTSAQSLQAVHRFWQMLGFQVITEGALDPS